MILVLTTRAFRERAIELLSPNLTVHQPRTMEELLAAPKGELDAIVVEPGAMEIGWNAPLGTLVLLSPDYPGPYREQGLGRVYRPRRDAAGDYLT